MKHNLYEPYIRGKETYVKTEAGTKSYHRFLVEQYLGFPIPNGYSIHHINNNHFDNRLENFLIIPSDLHTYIHKTQTTLLVSNLQLFKEQWGKENEKCS